MKLDIGGEEVLAVPVERLWEALNDPAVLKKCIPGCKDMVPVGDDKFRLLLNLKVASVGGTFGGAGTLGHGEGHATFALAPGPNGDAMMRYAGEGEIGGLVAGVGQRILKGVAKHLIGQFFTALRREVSAPAPPG